MTRKRTWYLRLTDRARKTNWGCRDKATGGPVEHVRSFARYVFVDMRLASEPGRELALQLTPAEAHALARELAQRADQVCVINERQGNGWTADAPDVPAGQH